MAEARARPKFPTKRVESVGAPFCKPGWEPDVEAAPAVPVSVLPAWTPVTGALTTTTAVDVETWPFSRVV